jgi:hypothetical protein
MVTTRRLTQVKKWCALVPVIAGIVTVLGFGTSSTPTIVIGVISFVGGLVAWLATNRLEARRTAARWPELTDTERREFVRELRPHTGTVEVVYVKEDREAQVFARLLSDLLTDSGWSATADSFFYSDHPPEDDRGLTLVTPTRVDVSGKTTAAALRRALRVIGLSVTERVAEVATVRLVVGHRP